MGLSIAAYAKYRGCDRKTVQEAIAAGRISTLKDGTINAKKADRDWAANTSASASIGGAAAKAAKQSGGMKPGHRPTETTVTAAAVKRRLDAAKADMAELDLAERRETLIPREAAFAQFYEDWRVERDAWVTWPARVAAEMAARAGIEQRLMLSLLEEFVERHLNERAARDIDMEAGRTVN